MRRPTLRNKPQWYLDMIPTALVPAVKIDGELVFESRDILMAIEKAFPESDGRLVQVDSFKPCVESAYGFSA